MEAPADTDTGGGDEDEDAEEPASAGTQFPWASLTNEELRSVDGAEDAEVAEVAEGAEGAEGTQLPCASRTKDGDDMP